MIPITSKLIKWTRKITLLFIFLRDSVFFESIYSVNQLKNIDKSITFKVGFNSIKRSSVLYSVGFILNSVRKK